MRSTRPTVRDRHEHVVSHMPLTGTGVAVCECGATRRVEQGKAIEEWHACPLCVAIGRTGNGKWIDEKGDTE